MTLIWMKCGEDGHWCSLERLKLNSLTDQGVYIIWCSGDRVLKVGQGDIRERLSAHRRDYRILRHRNRGELLVSWALVGSPYLDGIERYLGDTLDPIESDQFPDALPIETNLPWED